MKFKYLVWPLAACCVGIGIGLLTRSSDYTPSLVLGTAGLFAGILGALIVSGVHLGLKMDPAKTSLSAICGALLGACVGGYLGAISKLGSSMIALFNPDLPEGDFGSLFGGFGGVLIGACAGAVALAGCSVAGSGRNANSRMTGSMA